ncbi:hypothetical protein [Streptomyces sp. NPDC015130]|uniref:hypothetical protein n=1 Tax=Streptomyces sp. NPDC015130 TaxID=3364940 RepID=UPI0036FECEC5
MIDRLPVTQAVATMLAAASGKPVGRGARPIGVEPPYYLLTVVSTDVSGAPLADDSEDLSIVYQVTAVTGPAPSTAGSYAVADQADWLADKARAAFLARDPDTGQWLHPITVTGARVIARRLDSEPGGSRDDSDAIINNVQRFRLDLTPS